MCAFCGEWKCKYLSVKRSSHGKKENLTRFLLRLFLSIFFFFCSKWEREKKYLNIPQYLFFLLCFFISSMMKKLVHICAVITRRERERRKKIILFFSGARKRAEKKFFSLTTYFFLQMMIPLIFKHEFYLSREIKHRSSNSNNN